MKFLSNLDLQQNQLLKAVLQNVAGANDGSGLTSVSGVEGQILYNTDNDLVYIYTGAAWATIGSDATITITAGDNLNGGGSFNLNDLNNKTITINHDTITQSDTTSTAQATNGGSFTIVDGVTRDTYGHVTGINVKTLTLPQYTANAGIQIVSNNISHTNSITAQGTKGIYPFSYDAQGHVTAVDPAVTVLPNPEDLVITFDGGSTEGTDLFTYDGAAAKSIDFVGGDLINIDDSVAGTITLDHAPLGTAYSTAADTEVTLASIELIAALSVDGYGHVDSAEFRKLVAGNDIVITPASNGNITLAHEAFSTPETTDAASPAHEGTFDVIDSVTVDNGHITGYNTKTITLPPDAYASAYDWTAGTTAGPTGTLTVTNGTDVSFAAIPAAGAGASGIVTTGTQTFDGNKTFNNNVTIEGDLIVNGNSTVVNTQSLAVSDYIIEIAKDNTVALASYAGFVIPNYDGTNDGALIIDGSGEFRIGDVSYTGNTITDVASQPVLTRDEVANLTDGEILIWDSTAGKAIGGGDLQDLGGVKKFAGTITGDAVATQFTVANSTHGIGNKYMTIAVYEASTGEQVFVSTSVNQSTFTVTFSFAVAPATGKLYEFVLIG